MLRYLTRDEVLQRFEDLKDFWREKKLPTQFQYLSDFDSLDPEDLCLPEDKNNTFRGARLNTDSPVYKTYRILDSLKNILDNAEKIGLEISFGEIIS